MRKTSGFTIVEIIIICAVVGILAGIIAVGWNGTLIAGRDRARNSEQQDWAKRFETYRQRFGTYPASNLASTTALTGTHCLGQGFPDSRCVRSSGVPYTTENTSSDIMQLLAKVGTLPEYKHLPARGGYIGPWVSYIAGTPGNVRIYHAYEATDCPNGTTHDTSYSGGTVCYIQFTKN